MTLCFMRDMAMLATDWTGKPVQYTNIPSLRRDLLRSGAIAVEEKQCQSAVISRIRIGVRQNFVKSVHMGLTKRALAEAGCF